MIVQEMIDALSQMPRDARVIAGSDEEGNDFVNPYTPSLSWCVKDDTRCGYRPVHPDDVGTEYQIDELRKMVVL